MSYLRCIFECKKIEFKKKQVVAVENLFPSLCVECQQPPHDDEMMNCRFCNVNLHECCGVVWKDYTLCSKCSGPEDEDLYDEEYCPPIKKRRIRF